MYKVMIVEDEMLVRIGLKSSVDWQKFDMQVTADYADGLAAWEYFQRERPDLVMTDIRMPKLDGMGLIAKIREIDKTVRIIVLSCLEEFELVRKAMALDVSNYILKLTMTEEEIESVLHGAAEELRMQTQQAERTDAPAGIENLELVKEKMLKDFMFYGIYTPEEFERFAVCKKLRLSPVRMVVVVMEIDRYVLLKEKLKDEHGHLAKMTIMNILNEIMTSRRRGEAVAVDEKRYLLMMHHEDMLSERDIRSMVLELLHQIREIVRTCFNVSVSFGISEIRSGYASLAGMYGEALRALDKRYLAGSGAIISADTVVEEETIRRKLAMIRVYEPFRQLLPDSGLRAFEHYIDLLADRLGEDRKTIETTLHQFVQWIHASMSDSAEERASLMNVAGRLDRADTLPEKLDLLLLHLGQLVEETHDRLQMSGEIMKAIQYIKLHYEENISLQIVADHVKLSPGYLSSLFGKELQINFVEYLNRYRIERAKELLIRTQLKSADIAVKVGFSPEYTYFSKVFKKVTGLNPNDFRKRSWGEGADS
ncbi:response regulator [Cohnella fermenti]|uniref:Response regulator n=1 Tax=Cohnella fermenti TaxID=2565925 RepID=A0A4S4BPB0_9BACL|nr:response regulator [Cohnella fermenti]